MSARHFAAFARIAARLNRTDGAFWLREGQAAADAIELTYSAVSTGLDADGFSVQEAKPSAKVRLAEVRRIDPSRVVAGKEHESFRNRGRDRITVGSESFKVESCSYDGYEFLQLELAR